MRPTLRSTLLAIATAVALTVLPGCGSDSDEPAPSRPPRDAYVAKGDAICQDIRDRGMAVQARVGGQDDASIQAEGLREIAALYREGVTRLGELEDGATAAAMEAYIAIVSQNAGLLDRAADALEKGDVDGGKALVERARQAAEKANAIPQGLGFEVCGSG